MKYSKYKLWRHAAYGASHKVTISLPEDLKLYCENKESSLKELDGIVDESGKPKQSECAQIFKHQKLKSTGNTVIYPNQNWIGLYPYTKKVYEKLINDNVFANQTIYNLCDKWIVIYFDQIYPLCENWPETTEAYHLTEPCYVQIYNIDTPVDTANLLRRICELDEQGVADKEQNEIIKKEFVPVIRYYKINDISTHGEFDCTRIDNCHPYNGAPLYCIDRSPVDMCNVLPDFPEQHEQVEFITEEVFDKVFEEKVKYIFNK